MTRQSIRRGPSTRQFWTRSTSVPGVAHLLGECHSCHTKLSSGATRCPPCAASFDCPIDRQSLGLAPVRLLPGHSAPEVIARSMVEAVRQSARAPRTEIVRSAPEMQSGATLDVLSPELRTPRTHRRAVTVVLVLAALAAVGIGAGWILAPEQITAWWKGAPTLPNRE